MCPPWKRAHTRVRPYNKNAHFTFYLYEGNLV